MLKTYKNIVVAIDFSEKAKVAFERGMNVARLTDATLHLVSVIDTHSFGSVEAYDLKYAKALTEKTLDQLKEYKVIAEQAGVKNVQVSVEEGSPKAVLTNLADTDLIIVGATGLNRAERFLLGSVSENVVRSAKCDVLVVR
ncbi:universal stress protein [Solibacillus sp. FSL W7-1472]|uniref:Universal stress protein n=2 Tax=Solibacillus TaxID=648800 RepID=F2F5Y2_SOLSS|nr:MULTISPECIES: universal stress protein [Solibacillus]AMO85037.1 universal stress protein UspA [Solibacillus silvestris]EKB45904.1 Putative universal stress protein [Solibacillus isronensis B3W22]OBW55996.1 universal stress protein UspA [Solibacillus silvestris]BAK17065.1 universal stress protein UspA [Solibacillus silvestris StLB046]